jgi:hypothetical protein
MDLLGAQDNGEMELFSQRSIQIIIRHKWDKVKDFMTYLQFAPHIAFLLLHLLWNVHVRPAREEYPHLNTWTVSGLLIFITYFAAIELSQIVAGPIHYCMHYHEMLQDTVPICVVFVVSIKTLYDPFSTSDEL